MVLNTCTEFKKNSLNYVLNAVMWTLQIQSIGNKVNEMNFSDLLG